MRLLKTKNHKYHVVKEQRLASQKIKDTLRANIDLEYANAIEFAIKLYERKCRGQDIENKEKNISLLKKSSEKYIRAGQARNVSPRILKKNLLDSVKRNMNKPQLTLEQQNKESKYPMMAGFQNK